MMHQGHTRLGGILAIAVLISTLTACSFLDSREIELQEVVGTWTYVAPTGHTSELSISRDNSFTLENAPQEFFPFGHARENSSWSDGIGSNEIADITGTIDLVNSASEIRFDIDDPDSFNGSRQGWLNRIRDSISFYVGDPDDEVVAEYTRD
ncbi:hypothetical protein M2152_000344 [Microbacteriaceae bacterium SG_E_30_P1]|uniref:Lipocalin-like domain-containing protein n=1 Tax=Antiquaquibacter oligotrophicus TaxID=2880260 RepID=A0ABT6KM27_9MICO|nr:hypothetical protein [Antiquaquibacter oligotrophicus]MDH6180162.1 hypothetical protein [Antiquaquibacter oligotrophicus]UDF14086.1 hypothetical protein LH407_04305 [Antiquaquibacter oligotrophicus]